MRQQLARPRGVIAIPGDERRCQHVLEDGALRQQRVILKDEADLAVAERGELGLRKSEGVAAVERDAAGRRCVERAEDVQQRALAASGRTHHGHAAARRQSEGDVVQNGQLALCRGVVLAQVTDVEHGGAQRACVSRSATG